MSGQIQDDISIFHISLINVKCKELLVCRLEMDNLQEGFYFYPIGSPFSLKGIWKKKVLFYGLERMELKLPDLNIFSCCTEKRNTNLTPFYILMDLYTKVYETKLILFHWYPDF